MAPLRSFTRGYTGAKNQNQREYSFYIKEDANAKKEEISKTISSLKDIKSISPFEFTHFIRGDLFVFIDILLTANFKLKLEMKIEKEELLDIKDLCESYCEFYMEWLMALPSTYEKVIFAIC